MKSINTLIKLFCALAAIGAAIYLIATYGDKLVSFAKRLKAACPCKCSTEDDCADEAAEEEAPAAEKTAEEAPAEAAPEAVVLPDDGAPVAEEGDFVG